MAKGGTVQQCSKKFITASATCQSTGSDVNYQSPGNDNRKIWITGNTFVEPSDSSDVVSFDGGSSTEEICKTGQLPGFHSFTAIRSDLLTNKSHSSAVASSGSHSTNSTSIHSTPVFDSPSLSSEGVQAIGNASHTGNEVNSLKLRSSISQFSNVSLSFADSSTSNASESETFNQQGEGTRSFGIPETDGQNNTSLLNELFRTLVESGIKTEEGAGAQQEGSVATPFNIRQFSELVGDKMARCFICSSILRKESMRVHLEAHCGLKPFECTVCQARFGQSNTLNRHMKIHSSEGRHQCLACKKCFVYKHNLKTHLRICSENKMAVSSIRADEKIHSCPYCGRRFSLVLNLDQHIKAHKF